VIKELGKQEHLDSETFRWLRNAVGQVERDLQRALQVAGVPSGKLEELQNAANWMWEQAERKDIGPSRREAFELSARRFKVCPNCGADFEQMHPFSNLVPHWLGQCKPVGAKEQPADGDSAK